METFEVHIAGIPCLIRVDDYEIIPPWKGSAHTCPSSDDYYGYEDCEYSVLDQRGNEAPWLEKKITEKIDQEIIETIRGMYEQV